ncbi:MAG: hypothetical protein ACYTXA_22945 [Nostoc sp.]
MTSTDNNPKPTQELVVLTEKIEKLLSSHEKLSQELSAKILHLEQSQAEEMRNFLQQLAETLNSKKSNSLETTLQELTSSLEAVRVQISEQRVSQETLTEKIQQFLTRQQVIEVVSEL